MSKQSLEAGIVYVQDSDNALDILSDVESFTLFLNTNEFIPTPIENSHVNTILSKKKRMNIKSANKKLTKVQSQILDRYVSLFAQIQSLPTLDDDIVAFEDEVSTLQEESAIVQSALVQPGEVGDYYNPLVQVQSELDIISEKENDNLEKEEQLFLREKQLQAKEFVFNNSISSLANPHVKHILQHIDEKIFHLDSMSTEYKEHEANMMRSQGQYDRRQKQYEFSIAKLANIESNLQSNLVAKQRELDKLNVQSIGKAKELRSQEKALIQTSKQMSKLGDSISRREQAVSTDETELKKREQILEESWEKVNELKHEVISMQHKVSQQEVNLAKKYEFKEQELKSLYTSRIKELEREYEGKLKTLNHEFDSLSLKKEHLQKSKDSIDSERHKLLAERKEIKLLKTKYELQMHNNLDAVKSVRTHTLHHNHKPVVKKVKPTHQKESDALATIRALLEVAESEISLNPQLAKRTYKRVHELYQRLVFSEQTIIHKTIVSVHSKIQKAISLGGSKK